MSMAGVATRRSYTLKSGKPGEGYTPLGGARRAFLCKDHEFIISGPSETGKTLACCEKIHAYACKYPGAQLAIVRKIHNDMVGTVLKTFARVIKDAPVTIYGGNSPAWYDYDNGSRVWIGGLDNPGKTLSSERDAIYVNQAEELTLNDWETLTTRVTGRSAVMPYTQLFGDCNPGPARHWIIARRDNHLLTFIESRHEDNPTLFDPNTGQITEQGKRTMAILDALTGTRYQRLRLGKWASAEGQVYEEFDRAVHIIPRTDIPTEWTRIMSIDFGYTNPFSCSWWAVDPDGRLIHYRQIYKTHTLVEDLARQAKQLSKGENISAIICDHDAEDRATFERHFGKVTRAANKAISTGIQAVQARLKIAGDGKPRIMFMAGSLVERDEELARNFKPVCTEDEFEAYAWPKAADGKSIKEVPIKENDHGLDETRYVVVYVDAPKGVFLA